MHKQSYSELFWTALLNLAQCIERSLVYIASLLFKKMSSNATFNNAFFVCEATRIPGGAKNSIGRNQVLPWAKKIAKEKSAVSGPTTDSEDLFIECSFHHTNTRLIFHHALFCLISNFYKLRFAYFKGDDKENHILESLGGRINEQLNLSSFEWAFIDPHNNIKKWMMKNSLIHFV